MITVGAEYLPPDSVHMNVIGQNICYLFKPYAYLLGRKYQKN